MIEQFHRSLWRSEGFQSQNTIDLVPPVPRGMKPPGWSHLDPRLYADLVDDEECWQRGLAQRKVADSRQPYEQNSLISREGLIGKRHYQIIGGGLSRRKWSRRLITLRADDTHIASLSYTRGFNRISGGMVSYFVDSLVHGPLPIDTRWTALRQL